ncbi:hypothetical protein EN867_33360, partial [Mesorhizobium sp. M2D.F.Ca.ET.224.01.1.1]
IPTARRRRKTSVGRRPRRRWRGFREQSFAYAGRHGCRCRWRPGVYDNAAEFTSSIPTFAHHLRSAGYYTCLSGKMHFVGPDQLFFF